MKFDQINDGGMGRRRDNRMRGGLVMRSSPPPPSIHAGPYPYTNDLLQLDACRPKSPTRLPPRLEEVRSPLPWREWDRSLVAHPDQRFRAYLVDGLRYGFRVGFNYQQECRKSPQNMQSALDQPQVVRDYLATECSEGRVLGPLPPADFPYVHTSRFGVIPKGSTGKWRLILDMSSPEGMSVNDGIREAPCSLAYVSVEDAAKGVMAKGRGALMAKVDVQSAYRNVPIHPEDRWLMGMLWEGGLYIDTALPFGLRSAPKIFTAIADAVEWIARQEGVDFILHYLDDFLVVGSPGSRECRNSLTTLLSVFNRLGLPVAMEKLEGPQSHLTFLGFELDATALVIRIPPEKLTELQLLIWSWVGRKSCAKRELESLVGKLGHAARVVAPGRTFMRRMFELLAGVRQAHHHIRLSLAFRSDLLWWATFLGAWNGITMMQTLTPGRRVHQVWTDASGRFGCGAVYPAAHAWLQLAWPHSSPLGAMQLQEESILLQELVPIILACALWGQAWQGSSVVIHCDNMGTVAVVNSGYSKVPQVMHLLRCLFFIRAHFSLSVRAVHVPGVENGWADVISRNLLSDFFAQVPGARGGRQDIPRSLLDLLVVRQPDWTSATWTELFRRCFPPA